MEKLARTLVLLACLCFVVSCQKAVIDDETETKPQKGTNVVFNITQLEQIPFSNLPTTKASDISEHCSRIIMNVYQDNTPTLSKPISQKSSDNGFGSLSLSLGEGNYHVVILAHNGSKNPTMTNPEKITFGNGNMTDTFLWDEDINVTSEGKEVNVEMHRAVAMFRLVTTDNIPSNVAKIRFHYTGGSSTINALTGIGCVNSKQEETVTVSETGKPGTFEVYTFPKDDGNVLKMDITALDADGNVIASKTFEDVPISRNKITQYKGEFFGSSTSSSSAAFHLSTNDEWSLIDKSF